MAAGAAAATVGWLRDGDARVETRGVDAGRRLADRAILVAPGPEGPRATVPGTVASDWWLPGAARLCIVDGPGTMSVQLRNRSFAPAARVVLIGPTDRAHQVVVEGAGVVSVTLTPLGWSRLIRRPAAKFRNVVATLDDVARPGLALRLSDMPADEIAAVGGIERLHDLLSPAAVVHRDDALVRAVSRLVEDPAVARIAEVHERIGISESKLRALTLRHFGFPPKILLRRARFLRSLARVDYAPGRNCYSDIDPSYHDVPHFLRDAESFLGTTPRRFRLLSSQH